MTSCGSHPWQKKTSQPDNGVQTLHPFPDPEGGLITLTKKFCTDTTIHCDNEALRMHGGYGYTYEYKVRRLYRNAKALELYEGTKEMELISGVLNLGLK